MSWNNNQTAEQWDNNSYYSDEESEDDYAPLQMTSWGATATENRDGSTTVDVSVEGWASLIDPSVKLKANGIGSGQLHRKGANFKPVDESYIINRRLNLPVKGSGKKSRSGSSTPKSAPKKKSSKKSFPPPPPPPKSERLVPPSSSLNRGRPPIDPKASAWGSANLSSTPFWEQQQSNPTGSGASKYATSSAAPAQAAPQQSQRGQQPQQSQQQRPQQQQQQQQQQSQWGQQAQQPQQQSQWGQQAQQPQQSQFMPSQRGQQTSQAPPPQQQSQWGQPRQVQQPPQQAQQPPQQSQWGQPQQFQQPPPPQQAPPQQAPPQQSQWGQSQPPQPQQPQSQAHLSKYAHGSDASIYAPPSAPPSQPASTAQQQQQQQQQMAGTPCIKFNIQLGVGITAELSVYQNDSPEEVVNAFERRHHLNMSDVAKENFAIKIRELLKQYTGQ